MIGWCVIDFLVLMLNGILYEGSIDLNRYVYDLLWYNIVMFLNL